MPAVSPKDYARAKGVTPGRVYQWRDEGLPITADRQIDADAADAWLASRGYGEGRHPKATDLAAVRLERETALAEKARLETDALAGRLVDRGEVERAAFERARMERDAHLGFVARVSSLAAAELGCDHAALAALLDREMRAHLSRLADHPLGATP